MNPIILAVIGGIIRAGIASAAGAGVATSATVQHGAAPQDDLQLLLSALGAVVTIGWSMWQKYRVPVEDRIIK